MEKIYDLKREVKERQQKFAISDIAEMKVDTSKYHEDIFNTLVKKVADKTFRPILNEDITGKDKIEKIVDLINKDQNILIEIETISSGYENDLLNAVVLGRNNIKDYILSKEGIKAETSLKVSFTDINGEYVQFLTKLNMKLKKSIRRSWSLRGSSQYEFVADLAIMLAEIYILNQMQAYVKANKELVEYVGLIDTLSYGIVGNEDNLQRAKVLMNKFNIPEDEHPLSVDEECTVDYLNWNPDTMFTSLLDIYGRNLYIYKVSRNITYLFAEFYKQMIEANEEIVNDCKREQDVSSSYSKSFQTKKNIPQKVKDKMEKNKFLKWFGYVEMDELTDLEKISQIEDEFIKFVEYISLPLAKDHSLRFRRLGQHKALGLYYPGYNAVCIDLEGVSSISHELMHMIDYTSLKGTRLSNCYNFKPIIDKYKECVNRAIDKLGEGSKAAFTGSGKYNKSYYFTHTEIFARCGEIFFRKILKIDNSIVGECVGPVYEADKELLGLIEKYYKSIFGDIGKVKDTELKVSSAKPKSKEIKPLVIDNKGQFTFDLGL